MLDFLTRLKAAGGNFNRAAVQECFDYMDQALRELLTQAELDGPDDDFPDRPAALKELILENMRMREETLELIQAYETLVRGLRGEVVKVLRLKSRAHNARIYGVE